MKSVKAVLVLGMVLVVSACGMIDVTSRNSAFEKLPDDMPVTLSEADAVPTVLPPASVNALAPGQPVVTVNAVNVRVPYELKVSEANRYLPRSDIVWRGDPIGDRHAQVRAIFETAMAKGTETLEGPVPVDLDIEVRRFHALTEKARYTVGGVHSITFDLAIRDPETGTLLVPVRTIRADLDGFGGQEAVEAEARGLTQKVRITNHLAEVIRQELSNPEGYRNASLGFFQMLNSL